MATPDDERYYRVSCYVDSSTTLQGCVNTKHRDTLMRDISCTGAGRDLARAPARYRNRECCLVMGTYPYDNDQVTRTQCETQSRNMGSDAEKMGVNNHPCRALGGMRALPGLAAVLEFATLY